MYSKITREKVDKYCVTDPQDKGIRVTHILTTSVGVLEMLCSDSDPSTDLEKNVRGVVFLKDKIVLQGCPFNTQKVLVNKEQMGIYEYLFSGEYDIKESVEGSLIRVFYFDNKWIICTNRKLNAYGTKWGGEKNFGLLFEEAVMGMCGLKIEDFLAKLDQSRQYTFFLKATEQTRFVCVASEPGCFLYLVTCDFEKVEPEPFFGKNWFQPEFESDLSKAAEYIMNLGVPFVSQGLIFVNKKTLESVKIISSRYNEYWKIRDNESSLRFSFLRSLSTSDRRAKFDELYPDFKKSEDYRKISGFLKKLTEDLHQYYMRRYVRKENLQVNHILHRILQEINGLYKSKINACTDLKDKKKIFVSQSFVYNFLCDNPILINKSFKLENQAQRLAANNANKV